MVLRGALGLLFLLVIVRSSPTDRKLLADEVEYRLPTGVVPVSYTLQFSFPESAFTKDGHEFAGTATIDFKVISNIKEIKLHLSNEFISIIKLTVQNIDLIPERDYSIDPITDILTISTDGMSITVGKTYRMAILYTGKIGSDNYGIYKSTYINSDKQTVYLLATQFEATYARRAFPCFDEPSFKATYDVSVIYPSTKNLGVLFNTEKLKDPTKQENTYTVSFKTTPVMSTYLVAFTVSDFTSTPVANVQGDTISYAIWSRSDTQTFRTYAVEVGPKILQKFNEYTGRLYGKDLTKVDQVALPDFAAGAMENWGLVTYRETYLLLNPADSSVNSKLNVITTIAHELAHQWFGNLITCNWWSETFLNEGFATYFEYFIPHQFEPAWEFDKQFVVTELQLVLESDAVQDSQALQSEVSSPLQVSDKFGLVSYKKGGSVIRMLTHIVGVDNFKAGIQEYFQTTDLLYGTSIPSKLWEILQKHAKKEVTALPDGISLTQVMQNWVEKSGYPLLTVSLEGKNLKISQERFLLTGEDKETKWYVPITYVESESKTKFQDTKPTSWLTSAEKEKTFTLTNENTWVILNPLQTAYYRVHYDANLRAKIGEALKKENFDGIIDLNRAQIVDDLFNLVKAKKLTYTDVFKVTEFLQKDDSYYSWVPTFKGFNYMLQRIPESSEFRTFIKDHLLNLMETLYKSVTTEEVKADDYISTQKQVLALSWACTLGDADCLSKVETAFGDYKEKGTEIDTNFKSIVYCNALRNSKNATDYDFLWNLYTEAEASEKITILNSLGCSNNEEKLKGLLNEIIKEDSKIRKQDSLTAFAAVYKGSEKGANTALTFLVDSLTGILKKYPSASDRRALIIGIGGVLTTAAQVEKLKKLIESTAAFPADLKEDGGKALVQAQANIKWIADNQADLEKYYKGDNPGPGGGATAVHINIVPLIVVSVFSVVGFSAM